MFAKNLRGVLGATEVNKQVDETIESRPDDFWYFNNGITVTAKGSKKRLQVEGTETWVHSELRVHSL